MAEYDEMQVRAAFARVRDDIDALRSSVERATERASSASATFPLYTDKKEFYQFVEAARAEIDRLEASLAAKSDLAAVQKGLGELSATLARRTEQMHASERSLSAKIDQKAAQAAAAQKSLATQMEKKSAQRATTEKQLRADIRSRAAAGDLAKAAAAQEKFAESLRREIAAARQSTKVEMASAQEKAKADLAAAKAEAKAGIAVAQKDAQAGLVRAQKETAKSLASFKAQQDKSLASQQALVEREGKRRQAGDETLYESVRELEKSLSRAQARIEDLSARMAEKSRDIAGLRRKLARREQRARHGNSGPVLALSIIAVLAIIALAFSFVAISSRQVTQQNASAIMQGIPAAQNVSAPQPTATMQAAPPQNASATPSGAMTAQQNASAQQQSLLANMSVQTVSCIARFECMPASNGSVYANCAYNPARGACECDAVTNASLCNEEAHRQAQAQQGTVQWLVPSLIALVLLAFVAWLVASQRHPKKAEAKKRTRRRST